MPTHAEGWYVIQVLNGSEDSMAAGIAHAAGIAESDCFSPRWKAQEKRGGVWHTVERKLTPGYLFAISQNPAQLEAACRSVKGFARLLHSEVGYTPLQAKEAAWLSRYTQRGTRAIPLSHAVKDGDEVIVTEGPLADMTFRVSRIDRRRGVAYVHIDFMGRKKEVPLGLAIVGKPR